MGIEHLSFINAHEAVRSSSGFTRKMALASLVRDPSSHDRELFEEYLEDEDLATSLLAFLGLKKLFPAPLRTVEAWKEIFGESIDLLSRRACVGPVQMRVAALKALAFAPEHLNAGLIDRVLKSLDSPISYETLSVGQTPSLTLVQKPQRLFLPEGFALLLASLPGNFERVHLLRRELIAEDPVRLIPVLIALQVRPLPELTDLILPLTRSQDKRISIEAARSLLACGGSNVFLMILSLLKETGDPAKKALLLPLAANTGKSEVWWTISDCAKSSNSDLAQAALKSADVFAISIEEKIKVFDEALKSDNPAVACLAARYAWHCGHTDSLKILEAKATDTDSSWRAQAADALGFLPPDLSVPILAKRFDQEKNGDVIRYLLLSLRRLLPSFGQDPNLHGLVVPWLSRMMKSTDPFKRSQSALLLGLIGSSLKDELFKGIENEKHPHVISSLLGALGRIGVDKILVFSKFHDHPDSRVRANMISAMLACGVTAMPYFTSALKDSAPRVRSVAAKNLFMLGQLDIVATLNRMLLIPQPVSVLAGCYGLGELLRIQPPLLSPDHPLPLSVSRRIRARNSQTVVGPHLLNSQELPEIFREMAIAGGDSKKLICLLEEKYKRMPSSHAIRRMLAAFLLSEGNYDKAATLIKVGLAEYPNILADLIDIYRLSLKQGNLDEAREYGNRTNDLYSQLLNGCIELCRSIRGRGSEVLLEKLHHLTEPSMNLYNAMIQLKVIENDTETVLDLMTEVILARPANPLPIKKLADLMPGTFSKLKTSLSIYAMSFPDKNTYKKL